MMFPLFSKKEKFLLEKFNVPRCWFFLCGTLSVFFNAFFPNNKLMSLVLGSCDVCWSSQIQLYFPLS